MATRIKLTMAAFHGPFPEYDGNADDWEVYTYRLKQYFTANDIREDKKQRAILLSACGSETLKLIQSLISMDELETKKFDEIADAVQKHFHPKPSEIVSRFQFNSCSRNTGESIASFVAHLRKLSEHCNYGASLEQMLRDRLVCGIGDERVQRALLAEKALTYAKAFEICQSNESAEKNAKALRMTAPAPPAILATPATIPSKEPPTCYRCEGPHHPNSCHYVRCAKISPIPLRSHLHHILGP